MEFYKPYNFRHRGGIWCNADEAIRHIQKGRRIVIGSGCSVPHHLVDCLVKNSHLFYDNEIVHLLTVGDAIYTDKKYSASFRHNALFTGENVREPLHEGTVDYVPIFLSEIPHILKSGQMSVHCVLINVSPPDEEGMVSLGVSVDVLPAAISVADIVIAQVNEKMPHTHGPCRIPVNSIDYLVEHTEDISELPQGNLSETSRRIGKHLSRLIHDGDTLQLGIGSIPDAILENLTNKNDLGIHSEMISGGILKLYENGNINNKLKNINKGKSVLSFILGSKDIYEAVDDNPDFEFWPSEYTNDPFVICKNDNMVSVNSAIQIDITGQVVSDSIGHKIYSGFGGQVDFVRGAKRSKNGRSFIAMESITNSGKTKIVSKIDENAGVVTSRADVDYIVTEQGIAHLHGKNLRERCLALINIAHPDHKDFLLDYAKDKKYIHRDQKVFKSDKEEIHKILPCCKKFRHNKVYFRLLNPDDVKNLQDFFYSHTMETIQQRYHSVVNSLPLNEAKDRVTIDYDKDVAIIGLDSDLPYGKIVSIGRYVSNDDRSAELGFVVREDLQNIGIGMFMVEQIIQIAKAQGKTSLYAYVSFTNKRMLNILEKLGFSKKESSSVNGFYCDLNLHHQDER